MNENQLVEIQDKLMEIVEYFDEFCKCHNIEYYLDGGNAIGALRHKGFIPWDDDFDVCMTKKNYEKFIKIAETKLDFSKFYLQKENTEEWPLFFSKLRMNGTTYIEIDTKFSNMHKGFYIDIFCLYNVSKNIFCRYLQYFSARLLVAKSLNRRGYKAKETYKKVFMFFSKFASKKFLLWIVNCVSEQDTKYIGNIFTIGNFTRNWYPRNYFGRPRYVPYERMNLPVGENVEQYLSRRYGDFMEMPDEETRSKYTSHVIYYDTTKDYKDYEKTSGII